MIQSEYFWCAKCRRLVHVSEVDRDEAGVYSHTVIAALSAAGEDRSIVHRGLLEDEY